MSMSSIRRDIEEQELKEKTAKVMQSLLPAIKQGVEKFLIEGIRQQKELDSLKYDRDMDDKIEQEAERLEVQRYMNYVNSQIESLGKVEETSYLGSFAITTLGASPKKNCFIEIKQRLEVLDAMLQHTALSGHYVCEFELIQRECAIVANYCRGFTFNSSSWLAYKKLYDSNNVLGIDRKNKGSDDEKKLMSAGAAASKDSDSLGGAARAGSKNNLLSSSPKREAKLQDQSTLAQLVVSSSMSSSAGVVAAAAAAASEELSLLSRRPPQGDAEPQMQLARSLRSSSAGAAAAASEEELNLLSSSLGGDAGLQQMQPGSAPQMQMEEPSSAEDTASADRGGDGEMERGPLSTRCSLTLPAASSRATAASASESPLFVPMLQVPPVVPLQLSRESGAAVPGSSDFGSHALPERKRRLSLVSHGSVASTLTKAPTESFFAKKSYLTWYATLQPAGRVLVDDKGKLIDSYEKLMAHKAKLKSKRS